MRDLAIHAAQFLAALVGAYAACLGYCLIWMWQSAAQGRDPWTVNDRSAR